MIFKWEIKLQFKSIFLRAMAMRSPSPAPPRTQTSLSRLSLDENFRTKKGGKEKKGQRLSCFSFPWSIAIRHHSLAFRVRLYVKYEAPEKEDLSPSFSTRPEGQESSKFSNGNEGSKLKELQKIEKKSKRSKRLLKYLRLLVVLHL